MFVDAKNAECSDCSHISSVGGARIIHGWSLLSEQTEQNAGRLGPKGEQLGWDETKVGNYENNKQNGEEAFVFLINMDFSDYARERERFYRRLATPTMDRLKHKYKAYISYYLWQLERSQWDRTDSLKTSEEEEQAQFDEELIEEEKRRVAKTVLAAIRPEKELIEILQSSE
jgi:hypothetical protein